MSNAILCLEDNTTIVMTRGTHVINDLSGSKRIPRRYKLSAGDIIYFHPLTIHGGDSFLASNIRIHYYCLEDKENVRKRFKINKTFLLSPEAAAMVSWDPNQLRVLEARINGAHQASMNKKEAKKRKGEKFAGDK